MSETLAVFQTYRYTIQGEQDLVWDITKAKRLALNNDNLRAITEIPRAEMEDILRRFDYDKEYARTVDPSQPGIGAPMVMEVGGRTAIAFIVIDGVHRIARAVELNKPFKVRLLTDEASRACLVSKDNNPRMPWNVGPYKVAP